MKKLVLLSALVGINAIANAQTRLTLYEEFTGENCGPCAATNPGLEALISAPGNDTKIQMIKYMSPIPTAGTLLYPQAKTYADARLSYYSISSAPSGKIDGLTSSPSTSSPGHPANLAQPEINAAAAVASPFEMTITAAWDATFANIEATITVKATSAYAGTTVYLRTALLESLEYCVAPGTNGETHFPGVVRTMFPNATGTSVAASWPAGTTQTYTFTIPAPYFVDRNSAPKIVAWIQDDATKKIAQSAKSAPLSVPSMTNDAGLECSAETICIPAATGTATHDVTLWNKSTSTLTSATIYTRLGSGAYTAVPWTGSIAPGGSATVTLPAIAVTGGSRYIFTDSVNLAGDQNVANNTKQSSLTVFTTAPKSVPLSFGWEGGTFPSGWVPYDFDHSGESWLPATAGSLAHGGTYLGWFQIFAMDPGKTAYLLMPTPTVTSTTTLEFWEGYAQVTAANNDKLEVVYSTDCGDTWTALWSKAGADHATTSPKAFTSTAPGYWVPASSTSGWEKRTVDLSTLPSGSLLAIRGVSDGGNNMFIDDININNGVSVTENSMVDKFSVSPNPAKDFAVVSFNIHQASKVQISLIDVMGKVINNVADAQMTAGNHDVTVNTSNLASGLYMVKITTEKGSVTQRVSVVK